MKAMLNSTFGSGDYGDGIACLLLRYSGVIERPWGFSYIMTKKTIQHASADVGLIFTAYILRRIFNILDKDVLRKFLKEFCLVFVALKRPLFAILSSFTAFDFFGLVSFHFQYRTLKVDDEAAILPRASIFGVKLRF